VALTVIGILAATAVNASDFTTSIRAVVPGWFYPIFLLIVIFGVICNSILSVYSGGLSLQALGVPLARSRTVWIDVVIGTSLAVYGVLVASNFLTVLQNFLLWSIYWYAPFFGVYMAELTLTRGYYDGHELFRVGGRYWFDRGFRWRGIAALLAGMIFAALASNTPYFKGALSTHALSGGDLSAVGGFLIGFAVYWLRAAGAAVGAQRTSGGRPAASPARDREQRMTARDQPAMHVRERICPLHAGLPVRRQGRG